MTTSTDIILKNAARILGDEENEHWPAGTLMDYLNAGQAQLCVQTPKAYVLTASTATVAGARQSLPQDGVGILNIDGLRVVSKTALDREQPGWIDDVSQSATTTMWMRDPHSPTEFLVYPPSDGANPRVIEYAAIPADISLGDDLTLADKYAPAITDYVCYKCLAEDTDLQDPLRAEHFLGEFNRKAV